MCRKLLLFAFLGSALYAAGDGPLDRATLRGIAGVNIVVDPVDPVVEKAGATRPELAARLEDRLRGADIPIDSASREFVALRLTSVRGGRGPLTQIAVAITISLYQPVELVRDPKVRTATQTWEVETVLLAGTGALYRACQDSIDDLAARFVAAYRSVNAANAPKQ
jgi:hypothetical protein